MPRATPPRWFPQGPNLHDVHDSEKQNLVGQCGDVAESAAALIDVTMYTAMTTTPGDEVCNGEDCVGTDQRNGVYDA